ncbi:stage II sporulation protein E [Haloimpatiens sp. FM7330]|uniref:stage II sporulation protein E n=1 Tax=Haloimpatiens sp. FM7330 TaxID=3298610 RepID=UPI0036321BBE
MQYGVDIFPYERMSKVQDKQQKSKKTLNFNVVIKQSMYFLIAFLISRVMLIDAMCPFGIAFLMVVLLYNNNKINIICCSGCMLGYISSYTNIKELVQYLIVIGAITAAAFIVKQIPKRRKLVILLILELIVFFVYKLFVQQKSIGITFLSAIFQIACIIPLYYIIDYSIICFKDLKTKHLFNNEELVSMAMFISLIIAGTMGLKISNISITNILALMFILTLSYISGSAVGSASGVAIGAVIGMGSKDMMLFISIYGLCGLIGGIFREVGRWITAVAVIITFSIILMYSKNIYHLSIIEVLISSCIFLIVPSKYYNKLALELNSNNKEKHINQNYVNKIRNVFVNRLNNFSSVLNDMSQTLTNLSKNEKLCMKNKSTLMIENLCDRVCSNCNMKSMCWKRELHYTYSAFGELIDNYQHHKKNFPKELEKKCINKSLLIKNTQIIVNNYIINELWRERLNEGRNILAGQINNMSKSLQEIISEFNYEIKFNIPLEKEIIKFFRKEEIKYKDIVCFNDKKGKDIIRLTLKACSGKQMCVKEILPLMNKITGKNMCVAEERCCIDPINNECTVTIEQMPKYYVSSNVQRKCKQGESYNGDSYSFGSLNDGNYLTIISDGMGSGPEASEESKAVVELIEKCMESGFSKTTAINLVNSIMSLKFCDEEKFTTVDLSDVDLYTGEVDFIKVGAVASFIKRGKKVEVIKSKTLPIGILDKVDIEVTKYKVQKGDMIVMLSDGVTDYNSENVGKEDWVVDYLKNINSNNPKEIAEGLINKSVELSNEKVRDDMTVLVSKVYSLY